MSQISLPANMPTADRLADAPGLDERLAREAEHFDNHYRQEAADGIAPLSDFDRLRYTSPPANTIFPREFYYHLLAPLAGKDVLEIACGNGIDASIAAINGANVHAYDLSQAATDLTMQRAKVNGVADRVHTQVTGDLNHAYAGQTFDAILGYATLHHLPMQGLAKQVYDRLKPGGVAVFAEPVINSPLLDRLRKAVPYSIHDMTEDEQPLCDADIAAFTGAFDRTQRREFQMLSRIWPMFPNAWRLCLTLHWLDAKLLKLPLMRRYASVVVFACYRDQ